MSVHEGWLVHDLRLVLGIADHVAGVDGKWVRITLRYLNSKRGLCAAPQSASFAVGAVYAELGRGTDVDLGSARRALALAPEDALVWFTQGIRPIKLAVAERS